MAMLVTPYQGFKTETYVDIPHGTGTSGIASELAATASSAMSGSSGWRV